MRSMRDPSSALGTSRSHGSFFDGRTARARPVTVNVLTQGIQIYGEGARSLGFWSFDGLRPEPGLVTDAEAHLMHEAHPDARLVFTDPATLAQLRNAAPGSFARGRARRGPLGLLAMAALIVALLGLIVFVLVPRGAGVIARAIPADWEAGWGKDVARQMTGPHKVCDGKAGSKALGKLTARLLATRPVAKTGYPVTVTVVEMKTQNAFATLGGQIVVFSKLIEETDRPDELAGVLAHEIGHVAARHPLTGAIEATFTMLFAGLFGSGGSDMGGGMASLGGALAISSHSRAKEAEADGIALDILEEAGISPSGLADFFKRLAKTDKGGGSRALQLFSTHPALGARAAELMEKGGPRGATTPALTPAEWRALKRICG
jgi:hypothetical protein